ncbi:MAG TPA: cupredoxin family copper-binding protein [Anaeromyxobacteraceae bacterium]|jgi:plastocyanin|nr:cupredoxin family copper-binding protein [Anaeromyxobacteraceae bacterium]
MHARRNAALMLSLALAIFALPVRAGDPAPPGEIAIQGYAFVPATLEVKAGTAVAWVNRDEDPHTATADDGGWSSRGLDQEERFTHTFDKPGRYRYHCALHPQMKAEILVR